MITQCYHLHDIITQSTSEKKGCFLKAWGVGGNSNALDTSVSTVSEYNLPFSKETAQQQKEKFCCWIVL